MFESNNRGSHGRPSRRGRARRKNNNWSSSVVGTHAQRTAPRPRHDLSSRQATRPVSSRRATKRSAEVNQIHFQSRSVDERTANRASNKSRTATFMRQRDHLSRATLIIGVVIILAIALGLGTCAYRSSLSSSMALNDATVSDALVAAEGDAPTYTLITGLSKVGTSKEAASYIAVLRVDSQNNTVSLLNIPSNISASYSGSDESGTQLRDSVRIKDEGELVAQVSSLIGQDINHYVRVTDEDFASLVDSLGGLTLNVEHYVDDPSAGTAVIDPGEQTLNGKQALVYVSAKNYSSGFGQRATVQNQVFSALVSAIEAKGGIDFATSADNIANKIRTDLSFDELSSMAETFKNATFYSDTVPGSQTKTDSKTYWSVSSSSASQMYEKFKNGEDLDVSVDTSGVDKASLSIIILNGVGTDGLGAQAAAKLTQAGYTIQDTGNADSFVYDETLVIYRTEDKATAAEAIVNDLGIGRAVSASVYYNLSTDIQVVIGKDWTNNG